MSRIIMRASVAVSLLVFVSIGLFSFNVWRHNASLESSRSASSSTTADAVTEHMGGDTHSIVVVGGGLAGLAAVIEAQEAASAAGASIEIVLVEKMPKLGGNSAKASSGINALNPPGGDSPELFASDTLSSGGGLSDEALVTQLVVSPHAAPLPRHAWH